MIGPGSPGRIADVKMTRRNPKHGTVAAALRRRARVDDLSIAESRSHDRSTRRRALPQLLHSFSDPKETPDRWLGTGENNSQRSAQFG